MTKQQAEQLRSLCNHPAWNTLMDVYKEKLDYLHEQLESNPLEALRAIQGQVAEVRWLLSLKGDLNDWTE